MQQIPFYIDQTGGVSIAQLTARARRLKRQRGLDLLVVDYIQLVSGSKARSENRVQELTEITTGLKTLAKELNIPVLACSQLSRQVEQRDDKRPQLSDLRESGSIEQDADVVLFIFREEYYLKNKEPRPGTEEHIAWMAQMESAHGRAEVIIGKQRHGPTGTVELQFDAEVTRFSTTRAGRHDPGNPLRPAARATTMLQSSPLLGGDDEMRGRPEALTPQSGELHEADRRLWPRRRARRDRLPRRPRSRRRVHPGAEAGIGRFHQGLSRQQPGCAARGDRSARQARQGGRGGRAEEGRRRPGRSVVQLEVSGDDRQSEGERDPGRILRL